MLSTRPSAGSKPVRAERYGLRKRAAHRAAFFFGASQKRIVRLWPGDQLNPPVKADSRTNSPVADIRPLDDAFAYEEQSVRIQMPALRALTTSIHQSATCIVGKRHTRATSGAYSWIDSR